MPCNVKPHNSFPRFLLMRTRQPEGRRIKLIKTEDQYTREPRYWPFKGDTQDKLIHKIIINHGGNDIIIGRIDIFEVQNGEWKLIEDEAAERGAASKQRKEPVFLSMAQKRRYEYQMNRKKEAK